MGLLGRLGCAGFRKAAGTAGPVGAIVGAVIILAVYRAIVRNTRTQITDNREQGRKL